MKKQNGITLIALVITIIVLLILAGVSLSLVLGNNGVLIQASDAVVKNREAKAKEEVAIAWASATTDYWNNWATNTSKTLSEYLTKENLDKYFKGTGHLKEDPINSEGVYTVRYIANDQGIEYTFTVDSSGEVNLVGTTTSTPAPTAVKEWIIDTDYGNAGLSLGDLVKPKNLTGDNAYLANEKFFVIGIENGTVTLLAEKNVKTNDAIATNNIQSASANIVEFNYAIDEYSPTNVYYTDATNYSYIKLLVDKYVEKLTAAGLTLEDVELVEGGTAVEGAKGRLMWGTNEFGEAPENVLGINETGTNSITGDTILYGPSGAKLNYWLGSPVENDLEYVWYVDGKYEYIDYNGASVYAHGIRPVIKILQSKI